MCAPSRLSTFPYWRRNWFGTKHGHHRDGDGGEYLMKGPGVLIVFHWDPAIPQAEQAGNTLCD